jgi:hypothetical protein
MRRRLGSKAGQAGLTSRSQHPALSTGRREAAAKQPAGTKEEILLSEEEEKLELIKMELSKKERKLLEIIRRSQQVELKIFIQDGEPVRVEEVTKTIEL